MKTSLKHWAKAEARRPGAFNGHKVAFYLDRREARKFGVTVRGFYFSANGLEMYAIGPDGTISHQMSEDAKRERERTTKGAIK